jgi:hypothetical protein
MTTEPKPPAEVTIEPSLVRALLQAQHSDLAQLPLIDLGEVCRHLHGRDRRCGSTAIFTLGIC